MTASEPEPGAGGAGGAESGAAVGAAGAGGTPPVRHGTAHDTVHRGARFWIMTAAGWLLTGYGVRGLLHHHLDTRPTNLAKFVVGGALLHDLLFAPLVLVAGVLIARAVPAGIRSVVQGALIVSAMVGLFSYPLVRGYAHVLHNPTSLPHNYTANLAVVLAVVWVIAAVIAVLRLRRRSVPGRVPEQGPPVSS